MAFIIFGEDKDNKFKFIEQKNYFSFPVSVADDGNFSCHCTTASRHDLHLPVRSAEGYVLRALEWQWHGTCSPVGMY